MMLWHQSLIHHLPDNLLVELYKQCCEIRSQRCWKNDKKQKTFYILSKQMIDVSYVFEHPYSWLFFYHDAVLDEMSARQLNVEMLIFNWSCENYRGPKLKFQDPHDPVVEEDFLTPNTMRQDNKKSKWIASKWDSAPCQVVYDEHDDAYMMRCVRLLKDRGEELTNGMTLNQLEINLVVRGADSE